MNVLQFSGGIDSLACLLLRYDTPDMTVLTVATDGAYPEFDAYMERVTEHFEQVRFVKLTTNRNLHAYGAPVDVVPVRWTALGMLSHGQVNARPRYQDAFACCGRSIWQPMAEASKRLGATTIIRGQRADDRQKAPLTDGDIVDGITYRFPIENWTRERVIEFVKAEAPLLIPKNYREGEKTSRDCWDCTAYLVDNRRRIDNLSVEQSRDVAETLAQWRQDVKKEMEY